MTMLMLLGGGVGNAYSDSDGFTVADPQNTVHPEFARWCETDSEIIQSVILGNVINLGGQVSSQATPNLSVFVAAYTATILGVAGSGGGANLSIPTPDLANPRIDLVTVDSNFAIRLTQGTPSGIPCPPSLPLGHTALAYVYVGAQVTQILSQDLWSKRMLKVP